MTSNILTTYNIKVPEELQAKYKHMSEWYHPEIDRDEMLGKFKQTAHRGIDLEHTYPRRNLMMMDFSGAFNREERDQQMFQFWNKQFNDEIVKAINLITYLQKPKLILDVCAGDGTLVDILTKRGFDVIGADTYEWPFTKRAYPPQKMDYREALKKYRPDFVIGCWMPLHSNWTSYFRRIKSVKYYMIIGEGEGGCTGGEWVERKGWNMRYHDDASRAGLCRTDHFYDNDGKEGMWGIRHTQVYSFSRLC